jgi:ketosteroid isomerase-like protein
MAIHRAATLYLANPPILPCMDRVQLVRDTWEGLSAGDLTALEAALAPDAKWRAVEDGPWNCENRATIIEVIGRNIADGRLAGQIESVEEQGGRMIVGFRPEKQDGWPLDNGIRYMVVTMGDGKITEMKGCPDRKTALTYAASS